MADGTHKIAYRLGNETLTVSEYDGLVRRYSADVVNRVIRRILQKPYRNCLNMKTIASWCEERMTDAEMTLNRSNGESVHAVFSAKNPFRKRKRCVFFRIKSNANFALCFF